MAELKLERQTLASIPNDGFHDFREVALLEVKQQFNYRHSLGKTSKFFLGLQEGKVFATRCEACGSMYMPPRAVCSTDLQVTKWLELSGEGVLESWTLCLYPVSYAKTEKPFVLAYVRLEGTTSLLLHQLRNADIESLHYGLKVKMVFGTEATHHPLELCWFEPA